MYLTVEEAKRKQCPLKTSAVIGNAVALVAHASNELIKAARICDADECMWWISVPADGKGCCGAVMQPATWTTLTVSTKADTKGGAG